MANTLRIKRRSSGSPGAPSSLQNAELAFNEVDSTLYIGVGTGGAGGSATTIIAIGGPGAFVDLTSSQTIAGTKTFSSTIQGSISGNAGTVTNGVYTTDTGTVTNAMLAGSIANSKLLNSSVTIGSTSIALGATATTLAGLTSVTSTSFVGALTGNASTATALATARTIEFTGDATASGSFDGSANYSQALTLATVNSNVGMFTKLTVNAKGLVTAATTATFNDLAAPTLDVSWGGYKITNLADPVSLQDAATKNYVDSVAQGLDVKASVKVATTANITLSGTQTIDGITVSAGDRVLVKNQSTASQNGIYVASASAWSRSSDMDVWAELVSAFTFVEQGTTQADTGWVCTVDAGGTLGTTAIAFSQFSGAGAYSAGNGLSLTGNTFSVQANGTSLDVSASGVRINPSYVGQTSITTLGTVTVGTWNGGVIGGTYGGTGVNNGSYTITLGGNISTAGTFSTSGAFGVTLTATGLTNVTLPTSGTLVNTAVTALTSLASVGTLTSGTWNATTIGVPYGGTGVTTLTGLVKGNGTSAFSAAIAGTDYLDPNSTLDCGTF